MWAMVGETMGRTRNGVLGFLGSPTVLVEHVGSCIPEPVFHFLEFLP
jgi:hypothetical protein